MVRHPTTRLLYRVRERMSMELFDVHTLRIQHAALSHVHVILKHLLNASSSAEVREVRVGPSLLHIEVAVGEMSVASPPRIL